MKKSRFSEEQVIQVLREAQAGVKIEDLCKKHGISDATFHEWRAKQVQQKETDARRLKHLEEENQRLKSLVADLTLRNEALKRMVSKKW